MAIVAILIVLVLGVVGVFGAWVGALYAADAPVQAVVTGKQCGSIPTQQSSQVAVQTKWPVPGIDHTVTEFPNDKCHLVNKDNFVEYHMRSGRTTLYQREGGTCIYDSVKGIGC